MKRERRLHSKELVSKETLDQFLRLNTAQRLRWLDEARGFYLAAVPDRAKRMGERLRREQGL